MDCCLHTGVETHDLLPAYRYRKLRMRKMVVADSKERNELMTETLYSQPNRFQKDGDDRVNYDDVHDREMCDDDHGRGYAGHCDHALPSSATDRAPSRAIHS